MEVDDEVLFLRREGAALEVRAEVVDPPEAAALAAPLQPGVARHVAPRPLPAPQHVRHQPLVLLRRPQPLPQLRGRCSTHIAVSRRRHAATLRRRAVHRLPHWPARVYTDDLTQTHTCVEIDRFVVMGYI